MGALREILAALVVNVDDKALKDGQKSVAGFIGTLKNAGTAIGLAFGVTKIKSFIDGQIAAAAALRRSSTTLGIGTQALQQFQLAAELAGVEGDSMTTALRFLNRNLSEAAHGSAEVSKQFASVGIATRDGRRQIRSAGDVLEELSDKVAALKTPAEKTELAMRLLGRGGAALIPLLTKGSAAFADARAEVVKLGGGLSEAFIAKAKEASRAQHELDFALVGLKSEIALELLPAFLSAVTTFTQWTVEIKRATGGIGIFKGALEAFAVVAGVKTVAILAGLVKSLAAVTVGAARAGAAFLATWGEVLLPVTAVLAAVDILYYALTGKSLHGVVWDWLFGTEDPDAVGGIVDKLGGLKGGLLPGASGTAGQGPGGHLGALLPGAPAGKDVEATKALAGAVGENTKALGGASRALGATSAALVTATDVIKGIGQSLGLQGTPVYADRGAGARVEGHKVLRNTPYDVGPLGHALTPEAQRLHEKYLYLPGAATGSRAAAGGAGVHITQHVKTDIHQEIHTGADAKAVGVATGQGVATGTQRANDRARTALRKP